MNPHLEAMPDFTTDRHAAARQRLVDCGIAENLIIPTLEDIWRDHNTEQCDNWDERLHLEEQEVQEAERVAAEEANMCRQALEEEVELAK
ncbi:hypothetical protein PAXRUDRAFT_833457 [Paxillus rubicundulus Ve08.2h10]|uniref:Uncharacterized protein n=1 Tax=Paxillus rubicundulus Ve08.2h10 TaxID=930991 RepID=A0A0D0D9R4_9AGAM|nr:hypothetical protein PAXRUDRAFT_833457 [Paxillus rubicundulus Ve08.2h10]